MNVAGPTLELHVDNRKGLPCVRFTGAGCWTSRSLFRQRRCSTLIPVAEPSDSAHEVMRWEIVLGCCTIAQHDCSTVH